MKTVVKVALSTMTLVAVAAGSVAGTLAYLKMQTESDVNVMAVGDGIAIEQIELQRAEGVKHIHTAQDGDLVPFEQKQVLAPAYPVNGLNSDYTAEPTDLFNWGDYVYTGTAGNGLWNDEKLKGVIDKFVFVENTGDADCYFRTLFAFECPEGFSIGEASAGAQIMLNVNGREDGSVGGYLWSDVGYAAIGATRYAIMEAVYIAKDDILPAGAKSHPSLLQVVMTHNATNEDIKKLNGEYEILVMSQACQTENFTNAADALDTAFGKVTPELATKWFSDSLGIVTVSTADELATAIANGGTVAITKDIDLGDTQITVAKDTTIILQNANLTGAHNSDKPYAMFRIPTGVTLNVKGSGNVEVATQFTESNRSGAIFNNGGTLNIYGGNYALTDSTEGKTWIIATIIDNYGYDKNSIANIYGGTYTIYGKAINLFRNYPGNNAGKSTLNIYDGVFNSNPEKVTYIWNQESSASAVNGFINFYGGTYDNILYEDYNGQDDIYIDPSITGLLPYEDNT